MTEKPKLLVLYVEDENDNWEVLSMRLKQFNIIRATNSKEACELLKQQHGEISAILMDIQLKASDLNGMELTQLIRGKLHTADIPEYAKDLPVLDTPVIFLTAYGDRYPTQILLDAGGDQVITKPIDFVKVISALTKIHLEQIKKIGSDNPNQH